MRFPALASRDRCSAGDGKLCFYSGAEARRAKKRKTHKHGKHFRVYLCRCGCWHLSTKDRIVLKRKF
jgi:hypothetical protein